MILIVRSNSIVKDPRVGKYIKFLNDNNIDYKIIGWDRLQENTEIDHSIFYQKKAGYNLGGVKAVYYRLCWMAFCFRMFIKLKPDTIHGCDLDAAFPAVIYKKIVRNRTKIIFDVFDWFSATLSNQGKIVASCFRLMEKVTVKLSQYIFICEKERIEQIPYDISSKVYVLPNIPYVENENNIKYYDEEISFHNDKLTLSYVGGLYNERFLSELLDLAGTGMFNLLIAGYGDRDLEQKCKILNNYDNVKFYGPVPYTYGLHIMYNSDIIYAMYCKTNPNHIYAAPNKYYESMLLAKPIITTAGTIVGKKVVENNLGYAIEEQTSVLKEQIDYCSAHKKELIDKGKSANKLWTDYYKNYTADFLNNIYINLI